MKNIADLNWDNIETLFLDMDGTLLDLHFDNHFWLELVPVKYAQKHGLSIDEAKDQLFIEYKKIEGTLNWYCIDHWTKTLGLDIQLLKQEVNHLIAIHPCVTDFLSQMRLGGKRLVLLTNAHQKTLAIKMDKTQMSGFFDRALTSHEVGFAKEDGQFWSKLQEIEPYDVETTLFVDDSLSVLESARNAGLKYLLAISKPDSKQADRSMDDFVAVKGFCEVVKYLKS